MNPRGNGHRFGPDLFCDACGLHWRDREQPCTREENDATPPLGTDLDETPEPGTS